jgi:hypothetical protein
MMRKGSGRIERPEGGVRGPAKGKKKLGIVPGTGNRFPTPNHPPIPQSGAAKRVREFH